MTTRVRVVMDSAIPFLAEWLRGEYDDRTIELVEASAEQLDRAQFKEADALVLRTTLRVDRELLKGSRAGLVLSASAGIDHVDQRALEDLGVTFGHAPGCNAQAVVEWVLEVLSADAAQRAGVVEGPVGIVGCGEVGRRLALALADLGVEALCCDPPLVARAGPPSDPRIRFAEYTELLATCRVLSYHVPLTRVGPWATVGMIDQRSLESALYRGALVINAARGGLFNLPRDWGEGPRPWPGRLAIDVWPGEPDLPWTWLTGGQRVQWASPHVAGYALRGKWNASRDCFFQLCRFLRDRGLQPKAPRSPAFEAASQAPRLVLDQVIGESCWQLLDRVFSGYGRLRVDDGALRALAKQSEDRAVSFRRMRSTYPLRHALQDIRLQLRTPGHARGGDAGHVDWLRRLPFAEVDAVEN